MEITKQLKKDYKKALMEVIFHEAKTAEELKKNYDNVKALIPYASRKEYQFLIEKLKRDEEKMREIDAWIMSIDNEKNNRINIKKACKWTL